MATPPRIVGRTEPCAVLTAEDGVYEPIATVTREWFTCPTPEFTSCVRPAADPITDPSFRIDEIEVGRYIGLKVTARRGTAVITQTQVVGPVAHPTFSVNPDRIDGFSFDVGALNAVREHPTFGDVSAVYEVVPGGRTGNGLEVKAGAGGLQHQFPAGTNAFLLRVAVKLGALGVRAFGAEVPVGTAVVAITADGSGWTVSTSTGSSSALQIIDPNPTTDWTLLQLAVRPNAAVTQTEVVASINGVAAAPLGVPIASVGQLQFLAGPAAYSIDDFALAYNPPAGVTAIPDGAVVHLLPNTLDLYDGVSAVNAATSIAFIQALSDPDAANDASFIQQTTAGAFGVGFAFAVPERAAQAARLVYLPNWMDGTAVYPAKLTLKRGAATLFSDPGGSITPSVSQTIPNPPGPQTWTVCAFEQTQARWGDAATVAPEPRVYSAYLEADLPL